MAKVKEKILKFVVNDGFVRGAGKINQSNGVEDFPQRVNGRKKKKEKKKRSSKKRNQTSSRKDLTG